jgi:hypothetical protein
MCLHDLIDKKETLATCDTSTLDKKPCIVGYKIIYKDITLPTKRCVMSLGRINNAINKKWNVRKDKYKIKKLPLGRYVPAEGTFNILPEHTYPIGCHVYLDKQQAIQYFNNVWAEDARTSCGYFYFIIPVYFTKRQVMVTGIQNVSFISKEGMDGSSSIPTAVVRKYYIKPSTYAKILKAEQSQSLV